MSEVTGQQSWNGYDPRTLERYAFRAGIDERIARAADAVLAEDAPRYIGSLALGVGVHGAELTLDGRHGVPLRVLRPAGTGTVHTLHTRDERRTWREGWARHVARIQDRATAYGAEVHAQLSGFDGTLPVLGDDGQPLTGQALWTERVRLFIDFVQYWYYDDDRGENEAKRIAALRSTRLDPTPHALATDVATARGQLMDRLDDAAVETRRWLLDDPSGLGAGPATVGQEAALRLLESRRQAGRRSLRAADTVAALRTASTSAESLVRGVGIEDAPAWQLGTGFAISGGRRAFTWLPPKAGRWTQALRAVNPAPAVASKSAPDLGDVVLDAVDAPDGWTVAHAPRPAPDAHERAVSVTAPETPAPGAYELTLTARNACGPSKLVVTVTVPAPAGAGGQVE